MSTPQPPSAPGNPEPWSQPPEITLPTPTADVLASPDPAMLHGGRRRRTPLVFVAAAAVVALVLGGAAYAGTRLWYGSGTQPEEATPATVIGFARLDLSPGYGQRLKINNLLKKFPGASGKDAGEELTEEIFGALDVDEAAYRKHVEPWFGQRVGVGMWLDGADQPYGLIVLAVDDESAARAGLTELRHKDGADEFGFTIRDGYAMVAMGDRKAQEAAEAASAEAERESLADSAQFRDDVDWLPARQTALAWVDLAALGESLTAAMQAAVGPESSRLEDAELPSAAEMLGGAFLSPRLAAPALAAPGLAGPARLEDLTGRLVVGAQATDHGVEVRMRGFGMNAGVQPTTGDVRSIVDSLPADSAIAAATEVGEVGDALDAMLPDLDETLPEDLLDDLPPEAAEEARAEMAESRKQFEAVEKALSAVAGARLSIALTGVDDDVPALAATAEAKSADNAETLAEAARLIGDDVKVTTSGTKVQLTTEGYAAGGGKLSGQALYREALDGAPEDAAAVVYIDLQRLLADADLSEKERREVEPVKAVGIATGTEDGDIVTLLRVVIK